MKKLVLETKRPWNWKVFLVLVGLIMEKAHRFPGRPSREQLEELAKTGTLVIVHPTG